MNSQLKICSIMERSRPRRISKCWSMLELQQDFNNVASVCTQNTKTCFMSCCYKISHTCTCTHTNIPDIYHMKMTKTQNQQLHMPMPVMWDVCPFTILLIYSVSQKNQSPVHLTVVSTKVDHFYIIWHSIYWDNIQHKSYWFVHLTYIMLLDYLGKM